MDANWTGRFWSQRKVAVARRIGSQLADPSEGETPKSTGKFVRNAEHNHRHAKDGRKLAARWQKEREKVGATAAGGRRRERDGERGRTRDHERGLNTDSAIPGRLAFHRQSGPSTADRKVRVSPPPSPLLLSFSAAYFYPPLVLSLSLAAIILVPRQLTADRFCPRLALPLIALSVARSF